MSASLFRLVTAATTNLTRVRQGGGMFAGGNVVNTSASIIYIKLYNSDIAPTVGTTVPALTIQCAASVNTPLGQMMFEDVAFNNGIWVAVTGAAADNDATAVGANIIVQILVE
jgi:hypothetical protein